MIHAVSSASVLERDPAQLALARTALAKAQLEESNQCSPSLERAGYSTQIFRGVEFGMRYVLKVICEAKFREQLQNVLDEGISLTDLVLNRFNVNSEVAAINNLPAEGSHKYSAHMGQALVVAHRVGKASSGVFDIGCGPAIQRLREFVEEHRRLPLEDQEWSKIRETVRYASFSEGFSVDTAQGIIFKKHAEASLDFGALSKGFCVDYVIEKLMDLGFVNSLFEWGGEVRACGRGPCGTPWRVGILRPPSIEEISTAKDKNESDEKSYISICELFDEALATSGDYEGFLPRSKITTSFDPKAFTFLTPTEHDISLVTVKSTSAMFADAAATSALLLGKLSQARQFLHTQVPSFPMRDYLMYLRDGERLIRKGDAGIETVELRKQRLEHVLPSKVIVVGGGLAGLSAAIEAAHCGAAVTLLEKTSQAGGNSAKATSGINGWGTEPQSALHIEDSAQLFEQDTIRSAKGGLNDEGLTKMLSIKSSEAIHWLMKQFHLPLHILSQLGGHSVPRTHRVADQSDGTPVPVGYTIMQALIRYAQEELSTRLAIVCNTHVTSLITETVECENSNETYTEVKGVRCQCEDGVREIRADSVVLTTGGFGCDHTSSSLLEEHAPHLTKTATTNGDFTTGDGMKLAKAIGASLVDMDKVQLHPTAFVDPKDPSHPTKFLGPEALRGSGGILLNTQGKRFVNELDLRSKVTQAIQSQGDIYPSSSCHYAYCVLNAAAIKKFGPAQLGFYKNEKGFFQDAEDVCQISKIIGCPEETVRQTLLDYAHACKEGICSLTQKRAFPVLVDDVGPYVVGVITPAIHYCMGGIQFTPSCEVQSTEVTRTANLKSSTKSILRLFAAGEVTGGLHGGNRLGGNSLLECVVYGRIAGDRAAAVSQRSFRGLTSEWHPVVLRERYEGTEYGKGSVVLRFNLPSSVQTSGLEIGQFVEIQGEWNGQELLGYYSPISLPKERGVIGLLARTDKGTLSEWVNALHPGTTVLMRRSGGPKLHCDPQVPALLYNKKALRSVCMIAEELELLQCYS